jgi:hypothetical protein
MIEHQSEYRPALQGEHRPALIVADRREDLDIVALTGGRYTTPDSVTVTQVPTWTEFPAGLLPGPAADYAIAASQSIPSNVAFVGPAMIVAMAMAIGNRSVIELKRGWREFAAIWAVIIGMSGGAKSPSLSYAMAPIRKMESENRKQYQEELEAHRAAEKEKKEGKETGKWNKAPIAKRLWTSSVTVEKLGGMLSENGGSMGVIRDELAAWFGEFDRYAKNGSSDKQAWIEFHSGQPVAIDRKGGDTPSIYIEHPCVSVTGTTQPGIFARQMTASHFESGFTSRLLCVRPPVQPKRWSETEVSDDIARGWMRLIRTMSTMGGIPSAPHVYSITGDAKRLWVAYCNATGERAATLPEGPIQWLAAKAQMHCARMALVVHMGRLAANEVNIDNSYITTHSISNAIRLTEWFLQETARTYIDLDLGAEVLTDKHKVLMQMLPSFEGSAFVEAAQQMGVTDRTGRNWLREMVESGDIEKHHRGHYSKLRDFSFRFPFLPDLPFPDGEDRI